MWAMIHYVRLSLSMASMERVHIELGLTTKRFQGDLRA